MAPPFNMFLCLVIYVGLAWFSVVAKPIELPSLNQSRHMSNLSHIVATVGGVRNEDIHSVDNPQLLNSVVATPSCTNHVPCASGCLATNATSNAHTRTCSTPSHNSLDGESVGPTHSCYTHGRATAKLNAVHSIPTDSNVAPFLSLGIYDYSPPPYSTAPVDPALPAITDSIDTNLDPPFGAAPLTGNTVTFTTRIPHSNDGGSYEPAFTPVPADAPTPVPGQQTVYVTITDDPTTPTPIPTEPYSTKPLSTGPPESNNTAIILGSVFGSLAVLCISIVLVAHILKLRRQKREELQESHESQECRVSISSVKDMSELLRQQQQTYGYYGTQRVASSTIVPQQMKSFPVSSEPVELPAPKDDTAEKERRDSH